MAKLFEAKSVEKNLGEQRIKGSRNTKVNCKQINMNFFEIIVKRLVPYHVVNVARRSVCVVCCVCVMWTRFILIITKIYYFEITLA